MMTLSLVQSCYIKMKAGKFTIGHGSNNKAIHASIAETKRSAQLSLIASDENVNFDSKVHAAF